MTQIKDGVKRYKKLQQLHVLKGLTCPKHCVSQHRRQIFVSVLHQRHFLVNGEHEPTGADVVLKIVSYW